MAILKRPKQETINDYVTEDTGEYFTMKKWLTRIDKAVDIDTGESWRIDSDCKQIYAYLANFGKCHGWNNIYPNQELISTELCINTKTLQRKIKVLGEAGLIDVIKMKVEGENFFSNRYRVHTARSVGRRKWIDWKGRVLQGEFYKFSYKQFKK